MEACFFTYLERPSANNGAGVAKNRATIMILAVTRFVSNSRDHVVECTPDQAYTGSAYFSYQQCSEPNLIVANLSSFRAAQILFKVGELGRGPRSCPFATLIGASERARKVKQNAPISVSNGHDLTLLPSSRTFEQKVCSPESAQFGKRNTQLLLRPYPPTPPPNGNCSDLTYNRFHGDAYSRETK